MRVASFITDQIPKWWSWGYWVSPLTYGFNAFAVNEMYAPRWMDKKVCYFIILLHHITHLKWPKN